MDSQQYKFQSTGKTSELVCHGKSLPGTNFHHVLIVDDDPAFRWLCVDMLEASDDSRYVPIESDNIEDALLTMRVHCVSALVVDYVLPDGTGVDLIQKVAEEFPDWEGPVILMTCHGSEEIVADGMRAGASDYIPKQDLTPARLKKVLDRTFERNELRMQLQEQNLELKRTNELLKSRNAEVTEFYHKISHEIKTPLTAARMFMSILGDGLAGSLEEDQIELVGLAIESCDELTKHLNDLIQCTRLETGKVKLTRTEESLDRLVRRSVAAQLHAAEAKGVSIVEKVDKNLPLLHVDAGRTVQILTNLVSNAVKFSEPGDTVHLEARLSPGDESMVEIKVSDEGIGISAQDIPHIFERLFQVADSSQHGSKPGLGLGLAICKELVNLHGGTIEVFSEFSKGTEFVVCLPAIPAS